MNEIVVQQVETPSQSRSSGEVYFGGEVFIRQYPNPSPKTPLCSPASRESSHSHLVLGHRYRGRYENQATLRPRFQTKAQLSICVGPGQSIVIDDRYSKLSSSTGLKLSARPPQSTSQTKPIQSSSRGFEQLPSSWGEVCVVSPIAGLHVQQSEICCCIGVVFDERLWFIQVECQRDDRRRSVKG